MNPVLGGRWNFTEVNVQKLVPDARTGAKFMAQYDFVFIDALHTEEFSSWYADALLSPPAMCDTPVIIHDIVAEKNGGGRESFPVYQYMAFAPDVIFAFTINPFHAPSPHSWIGDSLAIDNLRKDRVGSGPQKYFQCSGYGRDPSMFFLKTSKNYHRKRGGWFNDSSR